MSVLQFILILISQHFYQVYLFLERFAKDMPTLSLVMYLRIGLAMPPLSRWPVDYEAPHFTGWPMENRTARYLAHFPRTIQYSDHSTFIVSKFHGGLPYLQILIHFSNRSVRHISML